MLLAIGCGRKSPPVAVKNKSALPAAAAAESLLQAAPPEQNGGMAQVLQTKSAPELGQQLLETKNDVTRQQTALALADMGEKGYPHLAAGMRSNSTEQRLVSIQVIDKPTLLAHRDEMIPMLEKMLYDREPMIRRSAAGRLCWFGKEAQRSLRYLMEMANNANELPDIRQVALVSIDLITHANDVPNRGVDPSKMNDPPGKQ
jgi:hypothetical protein